MTRRLTLLALLADVLVAVPGPHDHARAASGGTNGRIAFVRYTGGAPLEEVYMVSPASGLTANLTNDPATSDTAPAWSPDGTRVAFARGGDQDDGLPFHIHTVTLATGKTAQVTSGRVVDLLPSWQPL
jgi:TolB protein